MQKLKLDEEIGELADLALSELRQRWMKHFGKAPSTAFKRAFLVRAIAHQLQVDRLGDISPSVRKRLKDIAGALSKGSAEHVLQAPRIKPGTRLVRSHAGRVYSVAVLEEGYEWEGTRYRSLSSVAKAITGTNWNGLAFFGLKRSAVTNKNASRSAASVKGRAIHG